MDILINYIWIIVSIMMFILGIYFSFKLHFIHLNFKAMFKALQEKTTDKGIKPWQSLMMALAGRIGVGSLSGIALAVYIGGPGVLLWIWLTSLFCAPLAFAESLLATIYRKKDKDNYTGGPYYYIKEGLKKHKLAFVYASIILISFTWGFSTIQINTVSKCINAISGINPLIIGIIISILVALTIFKGVKKIAETTSKLVPIMTIFYGTICLLIIGANINSIPNIIVDIFNSALNFKTFGIGIVATLLIGMQKGIFSSEVGLGTGSIVAGTSNTNNPTNNALVQTFGIHIENLLIATITVLTICLSNYKELIIIDANGIELTLFAFENHLGFLGPLFISITIALFALASLITSYYYGESALKFMKNHHKADLITLKIITIIFIVIGSIASSNLLWTVVDIMVGIMAIINIYALFKLRKIVFGKVSM